MDVVYIVRDGENEEFKYSLRSLDKNFEFDHVWVFCNNPPKWLDLASDRLTVLPNVNDWGVHSGNKHDATFSGLMHACTVDGVADEFIYMNDDFYFMYPTGVVNPLSRGLLSDIAGFYRFNSRHSSIYEKSAQYNLRVLQGLGFKESDIWSYELHVPFPVVKDDMLDFLTWFAVDGYGKFKVGYPYKRTLYGNIFGLHERDGWDVVSDVKVHGKGEPYRGGRFLSSNDGLSLVSFLSGVFPGPSSFEVY